MEKPLRADYEEFQMTHRNVSLSYDQKNSLKYRTSANAADACVLEQHFILVTLVWIHHSVASKVKLSLFHSWTNE